MPSPAQRRGNPSHSPPVSSIEAFRITTTNENWRGKNDPAERRRIQNRINQRAFRERQRAGESSKSYRPRSNSAATSRSPGTPLALSENEGSDRGTDDESDKEDSGSDEEDQDDDDAKEHGSDDSSGRTGRQPSPATLQLRAQASAQGRDELAQLINRNFMQAVVANARHLDLNPAALRAGTATLTPRPRNPTTCPATLKPIELQYQLPHDPLIDTIPHPRLRFNILRAVATRRLDPSRFSSCMRLSGTMHNLNGEPKRGGLIVWTQTPDVLASWELSEGFMGIWGYLLEGCDDFIRASNVWRGRRGEALFPV
nr:hypothetical protein B0A51_12350 [Rachicladosporium sp. CCFEE 5018]